MLYNKNRKWRNHKHGFPRYRKKHIYNGQITDVFFIYSLFVHIINITVNKATFIVTEIINPSIRNSKKSTINTTSLSQSNILCYVKWNPHLLILISYVYYYTTFFTKKTSEQNKFSQLFYIHPLIY